MIKRTDAGLLISGNDLLTPEGRMILELHDDLRKMIADRDWWRDAATGKLWSDAVNQETF